MTQTSTEIKSFDQFNLKDDLLRGIYSYGWERPSLIQQQGIPLILNNTNVIIQGQSGTGKTGTFVISMLQHINEKVPTIQGLIVLNTRELADQVCQVTQNLGDYMKINCIKCIGKVKVDPVVPYQDNATILVGTPGKILTVLSEKIIRNQNIDLKMMVIDEFDKTLEIDFIPTIKQIFHFVDDETKVILSSATINNEVLEISHHFMTDPKILSIKDEELSLEGIRQFYINCEKEEWKFETILDLYKSLIIGQSIIFVNSKRKCDYLEHRFREKNFTIKTIHGGMEQTERDQIMKEFREGYIRILLSTDLTARGIDVPSINLVINYDLPYERSQYIHRIGRTGRYGKKGVAINLIGSRKEMELLKDIENCYRAIIPELPAQFKQLLS
ncbi:MAG: helicase-related protein [candidate division WOR-3 bacterium]